MTVFRRHGGQGRKRESAPGGAGGPADAAEIRGHATLHLAETGHKAETGHMAETGADDPS